VCEERRGELGHLWRYLGYLTVHVPGSLVQRRAPLTTGLNKPPDQPRWKMRLNLESPDAVRRVSSGSFGRVSAWPWEATRLPRPRRLCRRRHRHQTPTQPPSFPDCLATGRRLVLKPSCRSRPYLPGPSSDPIGRRSIKGNERWFASLASCARRIWPLIDSLPPRSDGCLRLHGCRWADLVSAALGSAGCCSGGRPLLASNNESPPSCFRLLIRPIRQPRLP